MSEELSLQTSELMDDCRAARDDLQGAEILLEDARREVAKALESLDGCDYMSAGDSLRALLIVKTKEENHAKER